MIKSHRIYKILRLNFIDVETYFAFKQQKTPITLEIFKDTKEIIRSNDKQ